MGDLFQFGVNIGGTFTDTVLVGSDGSVRAKKVLSIPDASTRSSSSTRSTYNPKTGFWKRWTFVDARWTPKAPLLLHPDNRTAL